MRIKSITDFTLAECEEYLAMNPNGEYAKEVSERMKFLKFRAGSKQKVLNEFQLDFNSYYINKQYEEAYFFCLQKFDVIDNKVEIIEKVNSIIPKLKNRILIPSQFFISYDRLIDLLLLNGYKHKELRCDGVSLVCGMSLIRIKNNKEDIIEIISSFSGIQIIFIFLSFFCGIFLSFFCGIVAPFILSFIFNRNNKLLLREIAAIIVKDLNER